MTDQRWFAPLMLLAATIGADHAPPRYNFSLDEPAEQRWQQVGHDFSEQISLAFADVTSKPEYKIGLGLISKLLTIRGNRTIDRLFPGLGGEIRGLAHAANVSAGDLAALSLLYDLTDGRPACTGIIAQTESGQVIHGRNFDYDFTDSIKSLTIMVDVSRGGEVLYTGTAYAGLPSFATAVRRAASSAALPHCTNGSEAFSFEVNERDTGDPVYENWKILLTGKAPSSQVTYRSLEPACAELFWFRILEEACTFEDAVHLANTLPLPAPCYFVIAGAKRGQGAIVSRDREGGAGPDEGVWRLNDGIGGWYLVETNYDHWQPEDPAKAKDNRREIIFAAMNATGGPPKFSVEDMWRVISDTHADTTKGERPVYNNITVFSEVMLPTSPEKAKALIRGKYPGR